MIDLLMGGSPCQGFSRAGKQLNFLDSRSKLFFDFIKAKEILKPKYFLLENVKMKKEWQNIISKYMGVEPIEINSTLLSAQKRPRVYWTNIPGIEMPKDRDIKLLDILEDEVDERYFRLRDDEKKIFNYCQNKLRVKQATKKGYDIATYGDSINLSCPNSNTRRGRVGKGKANTLDTQCNQAVYIKTYKDYRIKKYQNKASCLTGGGHSGGNHSDMDILVFGDGIIRRYTEIECERLQTLPDNYTEGVSSTQRYKTLGNGWTAEVAAHIISHIPETYLHTVVSLFDGISCGQVALERADKDYNQYYASEIDKYAMQIAQKNYPHTMQLGDVTKIDWNHFEDRIKLNSKVS